MLVKVALPAAVPYAKPLLPGMFGRMSIPWGSVERLFVPQSTVQHIGQLDLVEMVGTDGR